MLRVSQSHGRLWHVDGRVSGSQCTLHCTTPLVIRHAACYKKTAPHETQLMIPGILHYGSDGDCTVACTFLIFQAHNLPKKEDGNNFPFLPLQAFFAYVYSDFQQMFR